MESKLLASCSCTLFWSLWEKEDEDEEEEEKEEKKKEDEDEDKGKWKYWANALHLMIKYGLNDISD